ncbi:UDP-N-acetylglucosamine 2-epimerase [uncultured Aquimarina sp.]|uniref:UDP-N-acetylglucosamine 2-epimerase n=1 Tax=uncultured Aquimarina sp. TaxID=575652 RepID=UPI0026176481|nr:UDP-N-acetylglucosamine 2-epimerase [uncultured Aquimarina sp.]
MKIIAVTGARSEFDLLSTLYDKMYEDDFFDFSIVVTGAHLSDTFGKTVKNIETKGYRIADRIYNLVDTSEKIGRVISLGNQISSFAQTFDREQPDLIIVAGDREEAISVSMTAAYMDIPVAHFFGGDIAKDGNIDNSTRYAASKYSHLHFVTLEQHKETLMKLGEEEDRIYVVGNPAIDNIVSTPTMSRKILSKNIGFDIENEDYLVLIKHPIITETKDQRRQMEVILDSIIESNIKCLINYPNSDAGNREIIDVIDEYTAKSESLFVFKNLDRLNYVNLLRNATSLIGNSSSGLLEAPSLGLPAINIGSRQRGRIHGNNVLFIDHEKAEIKDAINKVRSDKKFLELVKNSDSPYGNGKTTEKVVKIFKEVKLDDNLIYKNITY